MHPRFHARTSPDKAAAILSSTGEVLSYRELDRVADQGAQALRALGVRNGDTVAFWLPNTLRVFTFYWAAQRAGVFITPVSAALTAAEAAYILADCGASVLLTDGGLAQAAALLRNPPAALRHAFWADQAVAGARSWRDCVAGQKAEPIADEQAGFHMVYSSGTTGRPKGVRLPLTGGAVTAEHALAVRQRATYGVNEATIYLSPAPLYHTAPLAFCTTAQRLGSTVVVMPKFDAEAALAAIARHRANFVQMVPAMFVRLLRLPADVRARYDLSSLRIVLHAAAPCSVPVKRAMMEWLGPIVYEYYGGSQGNGATFISPEEWLRKPGSVGRASWGTLHVCGPDGTEVPAGQTGLTYFEGGWDFAYLNDPEKTRESRHPRHGAWSTLGDIGHVDEDGYLFLTDRRSFVIISGGVNIYPQEAENVLAAHPKVADVAVIGVPDEEMGEAVRAVVQPLAWADASPSLAAELIAYCRARLSAVKCPRQVDFDPDLPRSDTGKLFKTKIRDRYWAGRDARVA